MRHLLLLLLPISLFAQKDPDWTLHVGARSATTQKNYPLSGADNTGRTLATKSIQAAIDACAAKGGGTVILKPGKYLIGSIFIKAGVNLHIAKNVELIGSENFADYPEIDTRIAGIEMRWPAALINIIDAKNDALTGEGTVNARGKFCRDKYWYMRKTYDPKGLRWIVDYDAKRVRTLLIQNSEDITIKGLEFVDAGFWTVQVLYSKYVTVDGIIVRNNENGHGPSTDGVDIDSSSWVLVQNCDIDCNDDDFCLKAGRDWDGLRVDRPTEYVVIRHCTARKGGGLLTIGSETSGGIRHVLATDLTAKGTGNGFHIKSATTRGGTVEDIHIRNIHMDSVGNAILFTMNWNPAYSYSTLPAGYNPDSIPAHWKTMLHKVEPPEKGIPHFKDIYISNITAGSAKKAIAATGLEQSLITGVHIENTTINAVTAGEISFAKDWDIRGLTIHTNDGSALQVKNSVGVNPTLYIIGDSTVKNGKGKGDGSLWGWGSFLDQFFDTTKITVRNYALGGRSSRTFITEGHWDQVLSQLKPGDYVIMQFGHNDGGPLDDTARARGTIKGIGEDSSNIYNPIMKKNETVHTYGWYMRKYVADVKEKGATAIICSPIPRNMFKDGKVLRDGNDYGGWAQATARSTGAFFIDLNTIIADQYDQLGPDKVKDFFPGDHTHTNEAGAKLNANAVVTGLRLLKGLPFLSQPIDRHALVDRHNPVNTTADTLGSLSVGNGRFVFTVDITGLQSFPEAYENGIPLGTESEWGWHSFPNTHHYKFSETLKSYKVHGRNISYSVQSKSKAVDYFRENPHRLQLGNIGLELRKRNGDLAALDDLKDIHQELILWTGEIKSHFTLEGVPVDVSTIADPNHDGVAVKIVSPLIRARRLCLRLRFPYPANSFSDNGDNWTHPEAHTSTLMSSTNTQTLIKHQLDTSRYYIQTRYTNATLTKHQPHYFLFNPAPSDTFSFTALFTSATSGQPQEGSQLKAKATRFWQQFWQSSAAVDFSGSTDPRAPELERRIILSQYLLAIQDAANSPPQETGLTYNSWYGRPHLEMHWWHDAQFALWNQPELLERSLNWYFKAFDSAKALAQRQGYKGVRWQKMTDPAGRESPSSVGAFLIWQQPHLIYLAELTRRTATDKEALTKKYAPLVDATAEFMASYAWYDSIEKKYILGPELIPAQERFKADSTINPVFELAYWRWALEIAQQWRVRQNIPKNKIWQNVADHLAPLPQSDSLYYPTESATDAYTNPRYRGDHPVVLAAYGFLPKTQGLDTARMHRTFDWVMHNWDWPSSWGWDYPLVAMTATRLGLPEQAIDALLMPVQKNKYLSNGHNYQDNRLRIYLPGNGGLLAAIALMCAGYDGCPTPNPGIPDNGKWKIKWTGLRPLP